ncbi:UNVERIFIED_CONTAM: hypothetical protein RMT77_003526 [Armadillidium vulgare]
MALHELSTVVPFGAFPEPKKRFTFEGKFSTGVWSEIHRGIDTENGNKRVTIRIVDDIITRIAEIEEEYSTLIDLSDHRNFPKLYGCFLHREGKPPIYQMWFVLEVEILGSIMSLSRAHKSRMMKFPENIISYVLSEIITAVSYLHKHHIMSRSIRGDNIFVSEEGRIKLFDFGFSKHLASTMSRRNTDVGSPYWMAPEVIECGEKPHSEYDLRSDVWSIGITAIELADTEPPYANLYPMRAMTQIIRSPPPTFKRTSDWSQDFADFISECLIKNPEHRPFALELKEHPFILETPDNTEKIEKELVTLMEKYVTHNKGQEERENISNILCHNRCLTYNHSLSPVKIIPDDLATLEEYSSEEVLKTLYERWENGIYYTWLADILIIVNPFKRLSIYDEDTHEKYQCKSRMDNDPHIYAVADKAHQDMLHHREHQTIVLTGESGSGKTFHFQEVLNHLCSVGLNNLNLIEKIKQIPVILDAFGNAATLLNLNATRHCRYLEITFTSTGKVSGAIVWILMLEKFRISQRRRQVK